MDIRSLVAHEPLEEKNGVLYFARPLGDVKPSRDEAPQDPRTWSYWRKENYHFLETELKEFSKNSILIDLGAGKSDFLKLTGAYNLCTADFYPYPGISVVCDLGSELPFKDSVADIVLATNLLEHMKEPNVLLAECFRILKPGGVFLGTVPFMIQIHQRPYDFYRYTEMNLRYLFEKHGFNRIEVIPVANLYVLLWNVTTSFFVRIIKEARFKIFWRILWKIVRINFVLFQRFFENRSADPDNSLGYLMKAYR